MIEAKRADAFASQANGVGPISRMRGPQSVRYWLRETRDAQTIARLPEPDALGSLGLCSAIAPAEDPVVHRLHSDVLRLDERADVGRQFRRESIAIG